VLGPCICRIVDGGAIYGWSENGTWREEMGDWSLCETESDSWAPPVSLVSLLRAASRDPNGQPTATQALPLLRLVSPSCVSDSAIGWVFFLSSFACRRRCLP